MTIEHYDPKFINNNPWQTRSREPDVAYIQELALVPFMLGRGTDKTVSQIWSESSIMNNLLPPGDVDYVDGETREV